MIKVYKYKYLKKVASCSIEFSEDSESFAFALLKKLYIYTYLSKYFKLLARCVIQKSPDDS